MITTAEFKKQIGKSFGQEMRNLGFKGTGFEYFQETDDFLFAVYLDPSRWGGHCSSGIAVHPKEIDINSAGKLNLNKLKIYSYEFKMSLSGVARSKRWEYSEVEEQNIQTIKAILDYIKLKGIPIINLFKIKPNILDTFEVEDLANLHKVFLMKTGGYISTTDIRFSWAMAKYFEKRSLSRAKEFAEYGLSKLVEPDTFFGKSDFTRILMENPL